MTRLYHGTAREDEFQFPKYKKSQYNPAPFSWFTTDKESAKRYAKLATADNLGRPRVLVYNFTGKNLLLDLTNSENFEAYKRRIGDEKVRTTGKHSIVYRLGTIEKHLKTLETGFIEKGIGNTIDYVFVENEGKGAHLHLEYVKTIVL